MKYYTSLRPCQLTGSRGCSFYVEHSHSWMDRHECDMWHGMDLRYLCEWLLSVIFQVLRVDVEVVVVDGERLGTLGDARHKLLHFEEDVGSLTDVELLHRNVGWGNTICTQEREGDQIHRSRSQHKWFYLSRWLHGASSRSLLVKSGATLSMVTSRFPRITGSFAIFSGLKAGK